MKRFFKHYVYGLIAKQWNSAFTALDAFVGLAVGAAVSTSIHAIDWRGALAVFATNWLRAGLQYIRDNPLPPELPDTSAPFAKLPEPPTV